MNYCIIAMLGAVLVLTSAASAQKPVAELPRVYVDTTWNEPHGGTTRRAHTVAELSTALAESAPGDVIVLDAGATYVGGFVLPAKENPQKRWIYIESSALAKLPAGKRVRPEDAENMPKIVTPNVAPAFDIKGGASYWRLAGLELTSASTQGCNPSHVPPINCYSYLLVGPYSSPSPLSDSVTIDRCYAHGSPSIDLQRAILANISNFAVIDSNISEVHMIGVDTQAVSAWTSPGPFKLLNNHLEAAGENVMFGGAGGANNPYVPSDIEMRNNYLFKPLSWVPLSLTAHTLVVKNAFEIKSGQRVLFDSNIIENVWAHGQGGFAVQLTVRSGQSGDITVINDITITNNIFKNVVSGINMLGKDDLCGKGFPNCNNAGSQDRWVIANNLFTFYDPTALGGLRNLGFGLSGGFDRINGNVPGMLRNVVIQHNTTIAAASTPCWNSIYFGIPPGQKPPYSRVSNNIWILDNALCRQPTGDNQQQGMTGLTQYMVDPSTPPNDLARRFYGNVMYVASGNQVQSFPPHNMSTGKALRYVDPDKGNYNLLQPKWTETSDGKPAGVDSSTLPQ